MTNSSAKSLLIAALLLCGMLTGSACAQSGERPAVERAHWMTDWDRRSIDLDELRAGGPPKDGIPSIDRPVFVEQAAAEWLSDREPVISVEVDGVARAYPLQIMTYHEIVNDEIAGLPVAVSFCPLCYSAVVFSRVVNGETHSFGVSGLLRHSDLVMYDRTTESLWQQVTGEAIVGTYTGKTLERVHAQIVSFEQFREAYRDGRVLSRKTGFDRPYGRNPYAGYDDIDSRPFLYDGPLDGRLLPMEKVVAVTVGDTHKAYPHRLTRERNVTQDVIKGRPLVVFHAGSAVSALDASEIASSREIGSTGVFDRTLDGEVLDFEYESGQLRDRQTGSTWTVTGRAVEGPLAGSQLNRLEAGDYFAFAWFAFRPQTEVYELEQE